MALKGRYVKELVLKFRRRAVPAGSRLGLKVIGPVDVARAMQYLEEEAQEVFCVLHLNNQNEIQCIQEITRGTMTGTLVDSAVVFRGALMVGATSIVMVHNHPSGDPSPSGEDIRLARQLEEVGRLIGVRVLDHVIIGDGRWVSLAQRLGWHSAPVEVAPDKRNRAAIPGVKEPAHV